MADKLFRDYFNEKVTDTVLPANAKVLIQDGTSEPTQINASSISTGQLVKVTENGKTGYRLKDADPANYGDIGLDAVDLSTSESASTTKGAIGDYSHASGFITTASGIASHASGDSTTASGDYSHAEGISTNAISASSHAEGNGTKASGYASHAEGSSAVASGASSHAEGSSTFARSFGEHSGGVNGTDYTPQSVTGFNLIDRLVNYGNGVDTSNRSDAYTLFKNGMQKFFTAALSTITNAVKGCVMLDDDVRLNIHDGDEFKPIPFTSEVATAAQGVKADNSVQLTAAQTVSGVKTFTNNIIATNGNVGIGTTNPTERLDVVGNGKFSGTVTADSNISANGVTVGRGGGNVATNTAIGSGALLNNSTGVNNHASGLNSLRNNTTGGYNTANGVDALRSNTTGGYNTANGGNALFSNTTGFNNTASGVSALFSNTTGGSNTANGVDALRSNTTGISNTANGFNALRNNTTGGNNTANGVNALLNNSTGVSNHAGGVNALFNNTTGNNNTANGVSAGRFIGDGGNATIVNNSVFFGFETKPLGNSQTNQIVIGSTAIGAGSNTVTLGNTAITNTILRGAVSFAQFTTATEPAYLKGAQFFNTTLDKMRIGGATAYETVTSS
jgi:hypothetical protein